MAKSQHYQAALAGYEAHKQAKLNLDLTRGKPSPAQLDLSNALDGILDGFYLLQDGTDVRNYGGLTGIPEARALGGALVGAPADQVLAGGNSSLTLMYQYLAMMMRVWRPTGGEPVKFLCQVPGYDRHFTICEQLGIDMICVPLLPEGPDMASIEALVQADPAIKGIWCVPRYSNPTGHTYSSEAVAAFASLGNKAGDNFRIMWDNAYAMHHLTDQPPALDDLLGKAAQAGCEHQVAVFGSTSKITFAGGGVAFFASSKANLAAFERFLGAQVIGFDKVNQLRHVALLRNGDGIAEHLKKHQRLLKPKFDLVEQKLHQGLAGKGLASWTKPDGGYFVSLDTKPGLAGRVVALAAAAGVKLTPAGATFPYGKDPEDKNIRIAPSYPPLEEVGKAMEVLVSCVALASAEQASDN